MLRKILEKKVLLLIGVLILLTAILCIRLPDPSIRNAVQNLENKIYDLALYLTTEFNTKVSEPIVVINIDDYSLAKEGKWPWPRDKLARLLKIIHDDHAILTAFDITFTEPDVNIGVIVGDYLSEILAKPILQQIPLAQVREHFDYDTLFANELKKGDALLGVVFHQNEQTPAEGVPGPPINVNQNIADSISLATLLYYRGNYQKFQDAATGVGFLSVFPDLDGTLRSALLLMRFQGKIYPFMPIAIAKLYYLLDKIDLVVKKRDGVNILEGIKLGDTFVPTDPLGRMLIPYIPEKLVTILSATEVLHGKIQKGIFNNKVVIVGSAALGLSDFHNSPIQYEYPGVLVHVSILKAILTNKFIVKPDWAGEAQLIITVLLGAVSALVFPFLSSTLTLILGSVSLSALLTSSFLLFYLKRLVVPLVIPFCMMAAIFMVNLAYGFIFESSRRREIREMFSQFVSSEHIDELFESKTSTGFEGERRELTVLFADIEKFTSIAGRLDAHEVKALLNEYFTPMTKIIFDNNGTIDKYVGDLIMAFWGAPLRNAHHASDAVHAALQMQLKVQELKTSFAAKNIPMVNIGIGINTGIMNVGDMGSIYRRAYTVIGDAVNMASRIEASTRFYNAPIIVGEDTFKSTQDLFIYRKLDLVTLKGAQKPLEIYQVIAPMSSMTDDIRQELQILNEAFKAYYAQEWQRAKQAFTDLVNAQPDVKTYKIYMQRIAYYQAEPPGADWDGVFVRTEK